MIGVCLEERSLAGELEGAGHVAVLIEHLGAPGGQIDT